VSEQSDQQISNFLLRSEDWVVIQRERGLCVGESLSVHLCLSVRVIQSVRV